jgi:hypothetical protein
MQYFLQAYKDTFQTGVPILFVKKTCETKTDYEIEIIIKEYLTISYVKTDVQTATIFFHLLLEMDKNTGKDGTQVAKYHTITLKIPREIRTGNVYFKFTANTI